MKDYQSVNSSNKNMENYLQYKKQTAKVQRYFRKGNAQEIRIFDSTLQKWAEWKKKIGNFFSHG